ncbi:hypothetical protein F383_04321 [Gossypium arboreum]|uniref:Uncharacterized protein n=1 Tax=Gossypium arboreum TaxID=29729 RepID=A0A0B0NIW8_GOSAR|nr:hypothetical protein F383_04321 [Gossypium arboreum]
MACHRIGRVQGFLQLQVDEALGAKLG